MAGDRITQALARNEAFKVNYPYYIPSALASYGSMVKPNEAIVTDIPWAVAWYANRAAIWLPRDKKQFDKLREIGKEHGQPITGLLLSQFTLEAPSNSISDKRSSFFEWRDYILLGPCLRLGSPLAVSFEEARRRDEVRKEILKTLTVDMALKYPVSAENRVYLFFTEQPVVQNEPEKAAPPR